MLRIGVGTLIFGSVEFLIYFLPLFMIAYGITKRKYRHVTLLAGSLIFYALGDPGFLPLLAVCAVCNYGFGRLIGLCEKGKWKRKAVFGFAVVCNVSLLAVFKLFDETLGFPPGISFYTFQMLSYLMLVYSGSVEAESSFLRLSSYFTMFPQLLSGPIVKYSRIREELAKCRISAEGVQNGLMLLTMGLASKVLLADRIGILWNEVQNIGFESISVPLAWLGAIAYSMKIYFDFYGYSLMAIGIGRMLGFSLPDNFREPYMARGVRDFYRRWHMTLGEWFKDCVYIPLGGNRKGAFRTFLNLFAVWVLTGLWHGFSWNYLIWGMFLFLLIVLERCASRLAFTARLKVLPRLYLWAVIPVSWMCFAIEDLQMLRTYLGRMYGLCAGINVNQTDWIVLMDDFKWLLLLGAVCCTPVVKRIFEKIKDSFPGKILLGILFWICVVMIIVSGENTFMYFRF